MVCVNEQMIEEYRFLRQEHEGNRKFVFERPLLIVGATLAAIVGLSEKGILGLLPIPFLFVLAFNLWFTFNRMQSTARIVAYIQLVHEGEDRLPWIGWENALRRYRIWDADVKNRRRLESIKTDASQYESMTFYGPIFFFHMVLGVLVTLVLVWESSALHRLTSGVYRWSEIFPVAMCAVTLVAFCIFFWHYRPSKLRNAIEGKRLMWREIFKPQDLA